MTERTLKLLVVEDNQAELNLIQLLLGEQGWPCRLYVASDGEEALEILFRTGADGFSRPDLVLLDLNVPKINGHEVLRRIRQEPSFQNLPVIVFSGSLNQEDVAKAYENQCSCYVAKPSSLDQFDDVMQAIKKFWLGVATLPSEDQRGERGA